MKCAYCGDEAVYMLDGYSQCEKCRKEHQPMVDARIAFLKAYLHVED